MWDTLYPTHQHPLLRSSFYYDFFRILEQKGDPWTCCRNHYLFCLITCVVSVFFDLFRRKAFSAAEALETQLRRAGGRLKDLVAAMLVKRRRSEKKLRNSSRFFVQPEPASEQLWLNLWSPWKTI
jgi:hypothetical protein